MIMSSNFDSDSFIRLQITEITNVLNGSKAMIACSGGVDSTTCAVLTHKAIGGNLQCIFLDTGFMRRGEPEKVIETYREPPLNLPIKLVNVQKRFIDAISGKEDAEDKRKTFRELFYQVLSEQANVERCNFLVQGTIAADVIETKGGIKTQHNVLEQIGINPVERYGFKVIEPLVKLYKDEVRQVARKLMIPPNIAERQPFPGPGLSVRVVGSLNEEKLALLQKATEIIEKAFTDKEAQQYFAVILPYQEVELPETQVLVNRIVEILSLPQENINGLFLKSKATGISNNERVYGNIFCITIRDVQGSLFQPNFDLLLGLQSTLTDELSTLSRVLYKTSKEERSGEYIIVIRAVVTKDFITAEPFPIDWTMITDASKNILNLDRRISSIYYDITSKPAGTIEFE